MSESQDDISKTIKETVENKTAKEIVATMLQIEGVNWEPFAILAACGNFCKIGAGVLTVGGMKINVTEENCWQKTDDICFALKEKGIFRDTIGYILKEKLPTIKIVWYKDGQSFISEYFDLFKDQESTDSFSEAYGKIWSIIAKGKGLRTTAAYVETKIIKTVQFE